MNEPTNQPISASQLAGISETLLAALYCRATETQNPKGLIRDEKAVEIMNRLDYDFSRFENMRGVFAVARRTEILDEKTGDFLAHHPDGIVINLGAGLDARFERLDNDQVTWYEIDLPAVMTLRERLFDANLRRHNIRASVFDLDWLGDIPREKPTLLIAEGLLQYFKEDAVKGFLTRLAEHYTDQSAEMLLEAIPTTASGLSDQHDVATRLDMPVQSEGVAMPWGIDHAQTLESWYPTIKVLGEWLYFDRHRGRLGLIGLLTYIPSIKRQLSGKIIHIKFL